MSFVCVCGWVGWELNPFFIQSATTPEGYKHMQRLQGHACLAYLFLTLGAASFSSLTWRCRLPVDGLRFGIPVPLPARVSLDAFALFQIKQS